MYKNLQAILLAAGKSSRFKTNRSKLLEKICGQEMILYSTKLFSDLKIHTTIVLGYQKEEIKDLIKLNHNTEAIDFTYQEQQLGTGHAVLCTEGFWQKDHILIMNGDMPLINAEIIESIWRKHLDTNADITFATSHSFDPANKAYGKVIKIDNKIKIVEAKDYAGSEKIDDCCINAGIYLIKKDFLQKAIHQIKKSSVTGEIYITELPSLANEQNKIVETVDVPFDSIRGINTLKELWAVEHIKRAEIISYWLDNGVRFAAAQNTHVDATVKIESGSYIGWAVHLYGNTEIGKNCRIEAFSIIDNSKIEDNSVIHYHSVIKDSHICKNVEIGPLAHIKESSLIEQNAIIGNFVEIKKSSIGQETKIKHLSYIGDAQIGNNVNIGAGTITCNHNGKTKNKTVIKDNAYVGSNNSLVAPLTIGESAFTAAGSTITENVPDNALAIARSWQINKDGYAKKLREKKTKLSTTKTNNNQATPAL